MRTIINLEQVLYVGVLCCGAVTGCATDGASAEVEAEATTGTLRIPIQQTGSDGHSYRLAGSVEVTGPGFGPAQVALDGTFPLELLVGPGLYTVSLQDGWTLTGSSDGGLSYQPVSALLASPGALQVRVLANHTDDVAFQFIVRTASGNLGIGFGVTAQPREFAGAIKFNAADGLLAGYAGRTVDFATYYAGATVDDATADGKQRAWFSTASATEFFNDPLGLLTGQLGPNLQGAFLSWDVTAAPAGGQTFAAQLYSQIGPGNVNLIVDRVAMPAPVPLDAGGYIQDVFFQENVPFQMYADDGVVSGTASGELRMRNVPVSN